MQLVETYLKLQSSLPIKTRYQFFLARKKVFCAFCFDSFSLQEDTEELLKNEEVDPNTVARDSKGKKKKKYLGRIQYKVGWE